jgi:hypothetical protein
MKWALVDNTNTVQNLIVYDGVAAYTPPEGLTLQQVNPWVQIGQLSTIPQPGGD